MADAVDRRVIMKTSVLPTARTSYAAVPGSLEEENLTKAAYNKNVISSAGRLGGTSKMTDISSTQWSDSWSSMIADYVYWETLTAKDFIYVKCISGDDVKISLDNGTSDLIRLSAGESFASEINYDAGNPNNSAIVIDTDGTSIIEYLSGT